MGRFSTFGFLNPFVQSRWKERAKEWDEKHGLKRKSRTQAQSGGRDGE